MNALAGLVRWIIAYAVTGGFWHFVAVFLIVSALSRVAHFVRVSVTVKRKSKVGSKDKAVSE